MTAALAKPESEFLTVSGPPMAAWDVVFLRAAGVKARLNLMAQYLLDPARGERAVAFTHCALALSDRLVIEAYPHAIKGQARAVTHPPGVRIVPLADLLTSGAARYAAVGRLRPAATAAVRRPALDLAATMMEHRYGLRRFVGVRSSRGQKHDGEWVGCADLVVKMLAAGEFGGLDHGRALGPGTLWRRLVAAGWHEPDAIPSARDESRQGLGGTFRSSA